MLTLASLLLAGLLLLLVSLQRTYSALPAKELKRRARSGDEVARLLYRAAGYGPSLRAVLWLLIGLSGGGFFLAVSRALPPFIAFMLSVAVLWACFIWLPAGRVSSIGWNVAGRAAPLFAWVLNYLHPLLDRTYGFIRRHRPVRFHTGLYDKSDLVELLSKQQVQADSRIEQAELDIALHALTFGDKMVRDILTPRRMVKTVAADEAIGPVLMAELHNSGHSRFPVYEGKPDHIVGTLYLRDLMTAKAGGKVAGVMRAGDICYIHEEQPLTEALQAIIKTRRHLLVVVNSFEEYVGIVTIEDVLEQVVGSPIIDEFDQYDDIRAVAAKMARKEHKAHQRPQDIQDITEVVE